jgi:hypothetical protein
MPSPGARHLGINHPGGGGAGLGDGRAPGRTPARCAGYERWKFATSAVLWVIVTTHGLRSAEHTPPLQPVNV